MRAKDRGELVAAAVLAAVLAGLYAASRYSYILFHSMVEIASVAVAFAVFALSWNTRRLHENRFFLVLGTSYLFVAFLGVLHMLTYAGMNVFPAYGANLPTQLWLAARYLEVGGWFAAFLLHRRTVGAGTILGGFAAVTAILAVAAFGRAFPESFVEGKGLTVFKVGSEYAIAAGLLAANGLLYRYRDRFDHRILRYLIAANFFGVATELCFTLYVGVYDFFNLAGHLFRLISVYLIYRAIIETGLTRPVDLIFRELRQSHDAQEKLVSELRVALAQVKTLKGFLPICASCKKIRNDHGYWEQIEAYILQRSEAEFSHGICPECLQTLYPQYAYAEPEPGSSKDNAPEPA
jgi:Membrane-associated sensor domain